MKAVFITGTDTGVGKTVVCGLLKRFLRQRGLSAVTQKWVQTGSDQNPDLVVHRRLGGLERDEQSYQDQIAPYSFTLPASPHIAARRQNQVIKERKILDSFDELTRVFDWVLVEGVGGLLVPFNQRKTLLDIAIDLRLPVLVVAANRLGAINHTLLTLEVLKARGARLLGVVFNDTASDGDDAIKADNPLIVRTISQEIVLGCLPHRFDLESLSGEFESIGKRVIEQITREPAQ
jgi:dethiobiotin synthetase